MQVFHKELPVYPKGYIQKLNKKIRQFNRKDWNCRIGSANPNRRGPPRPTPDNPA